MLFICIQDLKQNVKSIESSLTTIKGQLNLMNRKLEILLPTRQRQNHSPRSIVGSAQDLDIEEGEDDFSKVEDEMISLFRSELLSLFIPKERIELPFFLNNENTGCPRKK